MSFEMDRRNIKNDKVIYMSQDDILDYLKDGKYRTIKEMAIKLNTSKGAINQLLMRLDRWKLIEKKDLLFHKNSDSRVIYRLKRGD